jgi:hypothetical protein
MEMDSFNDDGAADDDVPYVNEYDAGNAEPMPYKSDSLTFDGIAVERLDRIEGRLGHIQKMLVALMPIAEVFGQFGTMMEQGGGGGLLKMLMK